MGRKGWWLKPRNHLKNVELIGWFMPDSPYWGPSYDTLYESWYQELLSVALLRRWGAFDAGSKGILGATAAGSAFAGLSFWSDPSGKSIWAVIAVIAALLSIVYNVVQVADKVKGQ